MARTDWSKLTFARSVGGPKDQTGGASNEQTSMPHRQPGQALCPEISRTRTPCTTSRSEALRSNIRRYDPCELRLCLWVCGLQIARSPFACHGVSAPASKLSRNVSAKCSASLLRSVQSLRLQMCELMVACCKEHPG